MFDLDTALKIGKELGIPFLALVAFAYFMFYKVFPDFLQRDREKDDANRVERKTSNDTFISELGKISDRTALIVKNFESGLETHKEALNLMKEQNKEVIKQVQVSHKDLTETIKIELTEVKEIISQKIDGVLKELSNSK